MKKKDEILLLHQRAYKIVFLLFLLLPAIKGYTQGLLFNSNDSLVGERTSYRVFKNEIPTFSARLQLKFDLSLWDNEHLGYIFNITDSKNNSYSLSYLHTDTTSWLNFNIDSKSNKIKIPVNINLLKKRKWLRVMVDLNLVADRVTIVINGKSYRASNFGFEDQLKPKITFGRNERYSEVPNMAIKNLTVSDSNSSYFFPLNEWAKNEVHDQDGNSIGEVENPVWLINESYFWKNRFSESFKEVAGLNDSGQQLFIYTTDHLIAYDTEHDKVKVSAYQNKLPVQMILGKSIVNPKENRLYVYEVNRIRGKGPNVASLNLHTLKWDTVGNALIRQQRHHHNIFYDQKMEHLFLFGGYGLFAYYNDFFELNQKTDQWDKVLFSGDKVQPRFFAGHSSANRKNEIYLFGGYGNETGSQVVGGRNFYDLYCIDLGSHSIKKLWEIKPKGGDFVPANNLILSKDQKYFYALCYPHSKPKTSLRLYRFSIKDGSFQIVSGTIPVTSERIESDINLFFNPKKQEFLCTIQEFTTDKQSFIKIYSLYAPPISQQDYLNSYAKKPVFKSVFIYRIAIVVFFLTAMFLGFFLIRQKRRSSKLIGLSDQDTEDIPCDEESIQEKRANAVYLLGEFSIYDKNQRNITYLFSPKIRQLFVLILLHSQDKAGVVSKKISFTLWPEKEIAKTKNIKGVTINHLRNAIADIDGIELIFFNDAYYFDFGQYFFCDYFTVSSLIREVNKTDAVQSILNHFDLIARGGLLQFISEPWVDDFKLAYEEALMNVILPELRNAYGIKDFKRVFEIIRVILNIDPFNEEAIKFKLKALRRTKGVVHAQKIYNEFVLEYKRSLGVDYPLPFDRICADDLK